MIEDCTNHADIGLVYRALKRSRARRELYRRLCDVYPLEMSVKDLASHGNLTPANAFGALAGSGRDYKQENSLVGMGLAERRPALVDSKTVDTFRATEYGLAIRDRLADYEQRSIPAGIESKIRNNARVRVWETQ